MEKYEFWDQRNFIISNIEVFILMTKDACLKNNVVCHYRVKWTRAKRLELKKKAHTDVALK